MTAIDIINKYIAFFEKHGHKRIANSPLVPDNDPTTLFTTAGMQPLVPYLLGERHPAGTRLVNVQNAFRAVDIEEVGDNRHTTFFRMLGNWSLGDYFKKEQLPWMFAFLTKELGIPSDKLFVTIFEGYNEVVRDEEAETIWKDLFTNVGIDPKDRIFAYGPTKNWWSRSGEPDKMPAGEPGGPSSEAFYDFGKDLGLHEASIWKGEKCHVNCDCGRFIEICNSVFMEYKKEPDGSLSRLPKPNVDFGGGLERLLMAVENQPDVFKTSLFISIIRIIEVATKSDYGKHEKQMRIIADHFIAAVFIVQAGTVPSNKERGYILRRLIRRALDNFYQLGGKDISPILETIVNQYKTTDPILVEKYEEIQGVLLEEEQMYQRTQDAARKTIEKKYKGKDVGDELMGVTEITADDAFLLYTTHGLSPTQIRSLGYTFGEHAFAEKMRQHKDLSRSASSGMFKGGLADHSEKTVMGHTATHLLHQALRDVLGNQVHQTGSNITSERVRFDFNFDSKLTDEEIQRVEKIVNGKIRDNLPVHYELISTEEARKLGAIGLFMDTYGEKSKIYFIGGSSEDSKKAYSVEFCGGPHVDFTGALKRVTIVKQENIGNKQRRIYAKVG